MKLKKLVLGIWGAIVTFLVLMLILPLAVAVISPDAVNSQATSQYFYTAYVRTLLHVYGKAVVIDSLRSQGPATFNNTIIAGTTALAKIDSFVTTAATDTTAMVGATLGDVFIVTPYQPAYSATPDTGSSSYGAYYSSAGYVIVSRTKLTPASTLKSGALYGIAKIDK